MATLAAMIEWLMARRPVVAALLIIATCFLLLRPIKKPRAQPGRDVATRAQKPPPQKRSVSISTAEVVLQFGAGAPQIIGGAVDALVTIARAADVYLVTQLPRDCDELETEAMRLLDGAGIFGADRCDSRIPPSRPRRARASGAHGPGVTGARSSSAPPRTARAPSAASSRRRCTWTRAPRHAPLLPSPSTRARPRLSPRAGALVPRAAPAQRRADRQYAPRRGRRPG